MEKLTDEQMEVLTEIAKAVDGNVLIPIDAMTDRQLMEHIARNMLTADRVVDTITDNLPVWIEKLQELSDKYPFLKTMLKFL